MKAKQRTLAFLLVLVLAAGAALALLTHANRKAEQAASEAEDGSIPLLDVTGDTLEQVAVQYEGETLTLLPGDGWTLAEDPDYHLDDSACDTIRTALADMRAKRQLEAQPGEDYGFDAPRLVVNVRAAGETAGGATEDPALSPEPSRPFRGRIAGQRPSPPGAEARSSDDMRLLLTLTTVPGVTLLNALA